VIEIVLIGYRMSSFAGCMSSVLSMVLFPLLYVVRLMRSFSRQECTSTLIDKDNASATSWIILDYLQRGLRVKSTIQTP